MPRFRSLVILPLSLFAAAALGAQRPLSREDAIAAAITRGPLAALIAADTTRAAADVRVAGVRLLPNLQASYTGSSPQYHVIGELPLEGTLLRGQRLDVARAAQRAARGQFAFNRATIRFDTDTAYTRALAAAARATITRRNAIDGDSLRRIAELRRDAGDASELDVQLAIIAAGQQANAAALDSLTALQALLGVQVLTGDATDTVRVVLSDTLRPPGTGATRAGITAPFRVRVAESQLAAAEAQVALERRQRFGVPSLTAGVEKGDPSGAQTQALPTVGVALPIPFPGRNKALIEVAEAERARATAALAVVRLASQREVARAARERVAANARVTRDATLLDNASQVAAMSIRAYREGAAPLTTVLEARRSARDIQLQYIDDLAALWTALAVERLVTDGDRP